MEGDLFSLEDEDYNELFIAQQPSRNISDLMDKSVENLDSGVDSFLGLSADDFMSPCVSLASKDKFNPQYSDISDVAGIHKCRTNVSR